MAEFNWNEVLVGTLGGITAALGGEAKPSPTAPPAPKPAPALSQMMPLLLIAGVGIVAFALLRK